MPKTIKKEKWGKPKLIVLVRGRPEEVVLSACKSGGSAYGPILSWYERCNTNDPWASCGWLCLALTAS